MSAILSRRGLFGSFAVLLAAPAIVRVASIMPVKAAPNADLLALLERRMAVAHRTALANLSAEWNRRLYGDGTIIVGESHWSTFQRYSSLGAPV